MGIPLNGSTFGAIAAEKNDLPDYENFITEAADYIRKRENRPYPGDEAVLEQLPYKYAGNRRFRSPEDLASSFSGRWRRTSRVCRSQCCGRA